LQHFCSQADRQRLFVGASLHPPAHLTDIESIVPNSQIIVNPPSSAANNATDSPVQAVSTEWHVELFLHPGDWVPWVGAAVFGTVLVLVFVVVGLHEKEKVRHWRKTGRCVVLTIARGREGATAGFACYQFPGFVECTGHIDYILHHHHIITFINIS